MGPRACAVVIASTVSLFGQSPDARIVAIVGGTLIDGSGAAPTVDGVIVIRDGRIVSVGPRSAVTIPAGADRVDAAGRFLIPGLADLHVHFAARGDDRLQSARWIFPTLLAYGVTTVKEAGMYTADARPLKGRLERGEIAGPRLFSSGATINGNPVEQTFLADPDRARAAVERSASFGADFIKIHNFVDPAALDVIVAEGKRRGLRVTGHVPLSMTMREAINRGMYGLEHVRVRPEELIDDPVILAKYPITLPVQKREMFWQYVDPTGPRAAALVGLLRGRDVYFDPTLVADEVVARHDTSKARVAGLPLLPVLVRSWAADIFMEGLTAYDQAAWEKALKARMGFVAAAYRAGVLVTTGTDATIPYVYPGESLHEELRLLVEAGLSPLEALRAATISAARALRQPGDFGVLAPNARADVVLLTADPLRDISNTRKIVMVWKDGRRYDPDELKRQAAAALAAIPR